MFGVHMNSAATLCPKLGNVGIKSTVCGPESFTPDHKPLLGEDPNVFGEFTIYDFGEAANFTIKINMVA